MKSVVPAAGSSAADNRAAAHRLRTDQLSVPALAMRFSSPSSTDALWFAETTSRARFTSGPRQTAGHSTPAGKSLAVTRMSPFRPRSRNASSSTSVRPPRGTVSPDDSPARVRPRRRETPHPHGARKVDRCGADRSRVRRSGCGSPADSGRRTDRPSVRPDRDARWELGRRGSASRRWICQFLAGLIADCDLQVHG